MRVKILKKLKKNWSRPQYCHKRALKYYTDANIGYSSFPMAENNDSCNITSKTNDVLAVW